MKYYCDTENCPNECEWKEGIESPKYITFVCKKTGKLIMLESEKERNEVF